MGTDKHGTAELRSARTELKLCPYEVLFASETWTFEGKRNVSDGAGQT